MRRIFLLIVVVLVLIGSGILTVQWGDSSATIKFNKEKAKERTAQMLDKARQLRADLKAKDGNDQQKSPQRQ